MVVEEGYKQTEIGILPKEWEVVQLGTCIKKTRLGGNYNNSSIPTAYPLIKMGNISRGYINIDKIEYIQSVIPIELDKLKYGDLLFNTRNTLELVGKVAIWKNELSKAYYNSNLMIIIFDEKYIKTSFFVNYMLNSKLMLDKLGDIAIGTTSVAAIYNRDLLKIPFPVPPLPEQQAIAIALSDIDGLIISLTKLIEKKKNIKQGAMQDLLTGKKRLDGFSGEWKNVTLKDIIINFIVPMRDKPKNLKGNIPWCRIEDFEGKYLSKSKSGQGVSKETIASMNLKVFPVGTLLVSCSAYLGRCAIVADELVTNQTFIGLVPSIKINVEYLYYVMRREEIKLNELSSGTTISYLSRSHFENYQICIPDIEEQNAIASVFSDIDLEVECLQSKLNKYKAIKQGMMQELLTGKTRFLEGA